MGVEDLMWNQEYAADVVIVGGGLAGLTAAALVARGGRTVTLLERSDHLGGRARTTVERDVCLNLGPHAWYVAGGATEILRGLGVELRGRAPDTTGAYAILHDHLHTLPVGFVSTLTTGLLSLRAKVEVARTLASLPRIETSRFDHVTVNEWLDEAVSDPIARMLLAATIRTTTYVQSPDVLSAGAALTQLQLVLKANVWYLDRGWQRVVDDLAHRARVNRARLLTGVHAFRVHIESGRALGVQLDDGSVVKSRNVIVATPPDPARELLAGCSIAPRQTVTAKAASLDLALARLPRPRAIFALGIDRPVYYAVHSATATLAPADCAVVHVAKYLDPLHPGDATGDERELETLMDRLQPGWRKEVVVRRYLPSMAVTYGVPTAAAGGLAGRSEVIVGDVAGLYLAGDWVGTQGQLAQAAVISAARAAENVTGASCVDPSRCGRTS